MKRVAFVLAVLYLFALGVTQPLPAVAADDPSAKVKLVPVASQPPAPPSEQENPDVFTYGGVPLWKYSKDSENLRKTATWYWRYENINGCAGDLRPAILQAIFEANYVLKINFIEDRISGVPLYGNCGVEATKIGVPVGGACLCRNFPYNNATDFDVGTITGATTGLPYPIRSQVAVVTHEFFHAWRALCEQYQWCQREGGNFAPTRLLSVMNTGPLSRHGIDANEQAMWWRTMGSPEIDQRDSQGRPNIGYGNNGAWFVWACNFHENATEVAVLVDRHDGRGVVFSGTLRPLSVDERGCQGIGAVEGLRIEVGAVYYIKQQNPASWSVSFNETRVP